MGVGSYQITSHIDGVPDVTSSEIETVAASIATVTQVPSLPASGGIVTLTEEPTSRVSMQLQLMTEWSAKSATQLVIELHPYMRRSFH